MFTMKSAGAIIFNEADVQRRACVFCPDEAMCDALREALGDRFGLDDRQTRPQVVTLYAQALERAFPEIYTHVTPLVSRRELKMAPGGYRAAESRARGEKRRARKRKKRSIRRKTDGQTPRKKRAGVNDEVYDSSF